MPIVISSGVNSELQVIVRVVCPCCQQPGEDVEILHVEEHYLRHTTNLGLVRLDVQDGAFRRGLFAHAQDPTSLLLPDFDLAEAEPPSAGARSK